MFLEKKDGQYGWNTWSNREEEGKGQAGTGTFKALQAMGKKIGFYIFILTGHQNGCSQGMLHLIWVLKVSLWLLFRKKIGEAKDWKQRDHMGGC